jgi:hypothetical protein
MRPQLRGPFVEKRVSWSLFAQRASQRQVGAGRQRQKLPRGCLRVVSGKVSE